MLRNVNIKGQYFHSSRLGFLLLSKIDIMKRIRARSLTSLKNTGTLPDVDSPQKENIKNEGRGNILYDLYWKISQALGVPHDVVEEKNTRFKGENTTQLLILNAQLQLFLAEERSYTEIYRLIVSNLHESLKNELLQVFVYNLVQSECMSEVTTLIHILTVTQPDFVLSNEIISLYLSKACELSHYPSSCLLYHEVIDNEKKYQDEYSGYELRNHLVPFLVSPLALEGLAITFLRNKDSTRVLGVFEYFKRFYSYLGHANTYKALRIAIVEAYSIEGNFEGAISNFRKLAFSFRNYSEGQRNRKAAKKAIFNYFRFRRDNIKHNLIDSTEYLNADLKTQIDRLQDETAKGGNLLQFKPITERNVYVFPGIPKAAILKGSLSSNDLPSFGLLMKMNVVRMFECSGHENVTNLLNFVSKYHITLSSFVIDALCDLWCIQEAALVLMQLKNHLAYKDNPRLIYVVQEQNAIKIFQACKKQVKQISLSEDNAISKDSKEIFRLAHDVKSYVDNLHLECTFMKRSIKFHASYISVLLNDASSTFDKVIHFVDNNISNGQAHLLRLSDEDIQVLRRLCDTENTTLQQKSIINKILGE